MLEGVRRVEARELAMMASVSDSKGRLVTDAAFGLCRLISRDGEGGMLEESRRRWRSCTGGEGRSSEGRSGDWTDEAETNVSSEEAVSAVFGR